MDAPLTPRYAERQASYVYIAVLPVSWFPSGPPPTIDFGEHADEIIRRMSSREIEGNALAERAPSRLMMP